VVFVSQYVTQRDARWFERPAEFDPWRWTAGFADALPRHAFFPYGGGMRHCVGYAVATAELRLALVACARRFRPTLPEGSPLAAWARNLGRPPAGVRLRLEAA